MLIPAHEVSSGALNVHTIYISMYNNTVESFPSCFLQWQVALGWIVTLVTTSGVLFGLTEYNTFTGAHEYDAAVSILYGGFTHLAWGVAVAWVVFACHMGYGGEWGHLFRSGVVKAIITRQMDTQHRQ